MLFKKKDVKEKNVKEKNAKDKNVKDKNVKEKKVTKTTVKSTRKPAAKTVKKQTGNTATKSGKNGNSGNNGKGGKTPDKSDQILSKLMAIEKEARLEQARDQVDRLEDEKIAENLELLLKIMRSEQ